MTVETRTHAEVLTLYGVDTSSLGHPDLTIPTVGAATPQGDVMVIRRRPGQPTGTRLAAGRPVVVVEAETTARNRHELYADSGSRGVTWAPADASAPSDLTLGWVHVPEGQGAVLMHTEEHGALAISPGTYEIRRQREFAGEWRRVAD